MNNNTSNTQATAYLRANNRKSLAAHVTLRAVDSGFDSSRPEDRMFLNILTALSADGSNKACRRSFLSETKA